MMVVMIFSGCGGGSNTSTIRDREEENRFDFGKAKPLPQELLEKIHVGFGGRNAFPFANEESERAIWLNTTDLILNENLAQNRNVQSIRNVDVNQFTQLQKYLVKSKYVAYWITKGWQESWFTPSKIQELMDAGYVPVFIYYYFGDALDAVPSGELLEAYYEDNLRVSRFMQRLSGTKLFIMEPEFNKDEIIESTQTMQAFSEVMRQGIENIEQNVSDIYFSLCMTDRGRRETNMTSSTCGYDNCALGDQHTWSQTDLIYELLEDKLSFISFQEMVAQFSRDPENPGSWNSPNPRDFSEEYSGIDYLDERILNFSVYLSERFKKPVLVPYMTIPTATWTDYDNSKTINGDEIDKEGWNHMAEKVYRGLRNRQEDLQMSGLLGYLPMALFDDPRQDFGGYQYFMNNEYHLGLIQSGAEDGVDKYIHGDLEFKGDVLEEVFGAI
jgi:hypothetical protein